MESLKILICLIYFFQIIVNINCQQYVPVGRYLHTATLVGTKIYFLGGASFVGADKIFYTNDFFYLDISESFDKTKGALPFVNLSDKASEIPKHCAATTTVFGELKDSIFFFGGNMTTNNDNSYTLMFSFNATESEWNIVTVSQGNIPTRRAHARAVTDSNDKIYIFGGFLMDFITEMIIFDAVNKIWNTGVNGIGRAGHTATFLPDTKEIIYIGGFNLDSSNNTALLDITNLDIYNTINSRWDKRVTKNPPEQRQFHTAVLTNDKRIIIFGGAKANIDLPVRNYYVVLDTKTFEWYQGKTDIQTRTPFRGHTATLYNDYMFIAFGQPISINDSLSNDVLIYKIEDYANFTKVNSFIQVSPDFNNSKDKTNIIIWATLGSILGVIILGFTGFIIIKKRKKTPPVIRVA